MNYTTVHNLTQRVGVETRRRGVYANGTGSSRPRATTSENTFLTMYVRHQLELQKPLLRKLGSDCAINTLTMQTMSK